MDSIANNTNIANDPFHSGARTIQFGKYTFLNCTDQLKTMSKEEAEKSAAGRNPGDGYKIEMGPTNAANAVGMKTFFKQKCYSELALKSAPKAVQEAKLAINAEMSSAVSSYYDGNLSEEELRRCLGEAGFSSVRLTGDLTDKPPGPEEDRWQFEAR